MKETRKIQIDKVRSMCIRNDYYTHGTCEEYAEMFEMCKVENPTTEDFAEIATDILYHSDKRKMKESTGLSMQELRKCIMFELINDGTITYIEE